jgi:uncharacterized protein
MKKLILLFLLLFSPLTVKAENIPTQAPTSGVYDPNGYLTNETINRIKEINDRYAESDLKPQIGIVIVNEVDGNIEQVANETARNWKIGFSDTNNGMLVVIDINNHKIRTETSNSMSTYITDYETSILNNTIKYDFRNGDYDSGVNEYLNAYTKMMDRVVSGKEPMSQEEKFMRIILSFMIFALVACMIGVLLTKLAQIFSSVGDDDDHYGGGSSGSSGSSSGGYYHHHYYSGRSYDSGSSSSSSSDSSSSWSGGGFGGGGSTGGW